MRIKIFYDKIKFRIRKTGEIKKFLEKVIREENMTPGDLIFVFTGKKEILKINKQFLNHNYLTDVIAFGNSDGEDVSGEIYICADMIKRNSEIYRSGKREETVRVMVHAVLHLCGYRDDSETGRKRMFRIQEERLRTFMEEA